MVSSVVLAAKFRWERGFEHYDDEFPRSTGTKWPSTWQGHDVPEAFDRRAEPTAERARRWLEGRDAERPFFLFVHFFDPHVPYVPPGRYADLFPPPPPGPGRRSSPMYREQVARYEGESAYTDEWLGMLLDVLSAEGLDEDTIVVITADHGEGLLDHGYMKHGTTLYEEVVRVPLLVRWPGRIAARRFRAPVSLVDLTPTLLSLIGAAPAGERFEGLDLAPARRSEASLDPERPIYFSRRPFDDDELREGRRPAGELYALRAGPWKYIAGDSGQPAELYHLERDPREERNLREADPERAAELAARLESWRRAQREPEDLPAISGDDREALRALGYVE